MIFLYACVSAGNLQGILGMPEVCLCVKAQNLSLEQLKVCVKHSELNQ